MRVRAKLELTVWYAHVESPERAKLLLKDLVDYAAGNGLLSGTDSDDEVETFDSKVYASVLSDG